MYNISTISMNTVEKPNAFSANAKQLNAQSAAGLLCQAHCFCFSMPTPILPNQTFHPKHFQSHKTMYHACESFPSLLTHSAFYHSFNTADVQFL